MNAAGAGAQRTRRIDVGCRQLQVDIRPGSGGGVPLVLASGIGSPLDVLDPFVDALPADVEVIRFDAPGVGGSPVPPVPYRFPVLARLLGAALDQLGYGRADILGGSWGGGLAQQFAFQNPRRCRRLVLAATSTGSLMVPGSARVLARMLTPRRHRDPADASVHAGLIYGGSRRAGTEDSRHVVVNDATPVRTASTTEGTRGYLYQLLGTAGWSSLPFLGLIRQPTLVLAGDETPIVPLINARIMARLLPHARLYIYHDGHLGLLRRAPELAPVVVEFLSEE